MRYNLDTISKKEKQTTRRRKNTAEKWENERDNSKQCTSA